MSEATAAEVQEHPATGFNVEDWLTDAAMPQESADVFKRADVIGELSAIKRQIELHREAGAIEQTAGETSGIAELEKRYTELVDIFTGSQLTIYVRALSPDERREIRHRSEEITKDKDKATQNADFGYRSLARSIVAVQPLDGERTEVDWTPETVRKIERSLGDTQMKAVVRAQQIAQNALPDVDADFLRKPSGGGAGLE